MADIPDDEFAPHPPATKRVAARALVMSAVSCRAFMEKDAVEPGAESLRPQ